MTPEEQRIALAEWAGWEELRDGRYKKDGIVERFIPDYPNDLNAVHLLEKKLPDGHTYWEFIGHLDDIVKRDLLPFIADRANATAAQRCEAILKTLNLWKP